MVGGGGSDSGGGGGINSSGAATAVFAGGLLARRWSGRRLGLEGHDVGNGLEHDGTREHAFFIVSRSSDLALIVSAV